MNTLLQVPLSPAFPLDNPTRTHTRGKASENRNGLHIVESHENESNPVMDCLRIVYECPCVVQPVSLIERTLRNGFTLYVDTTGLLRVKKRPDGETLDKDTRAYIAVCREALIAMLSIHPTMPRKAIAYPYDVKVWAGKEPQRPCITCNTANWQPRFSGAYWIHGCATCHPEIVASQGLEYHLD